MVDPLPYYVYLRVYLLFQVCNLKNLSYLIGKIAGMHGSSNILLMHCPPTCRECELLKDKTTKGKHLPVRTYMRTRASTLGASKTLCAQSLPASIRHIQWNELQASCSGSMVLIGKGTFAKCYYMKLGAMKVCIKILNSSDKYKALFCAEARILSLLCHCNLPWLHAICDDSTKTAIMMTYSYEGDKSLSVYDALSKDVEIHRSEWQQVLLGCTSALIYLRSRYPPQ